MFHHGSKQCGEGAAKQRTDVSNNEEKNRISTTSLPTYDPPQYMNGPGWPKTASLFKSSLRILALGPGFIIKLGKPKGGHEIRF